MGGTFVIKKQHSERNNNSFSSLGERERERERESAEEETRREGASAKSAERLASDAIPASAIVNASRANERGAAGEAARPPVNSGGRGLLYWLVNGEAEVSSPCGRGSAAHGHRCISRVFVRGSPITFGSLRGAYKNGRTLHRASTTTNERTNERTSGATGEMRRARARDMNHCRTEWLGSSRS